MESKQESKIIDNSLVESREQKKVVVITVWYNREEHVEDSIGSLLNQTADNYTVLAVDDGSTDNTAEKLEGMLSKAETHNVPMRVWKKPNEGFTSSIKRAIEEKSDERIISIHGAGDISLPERIETQCEVLEKSLGVNTVGVGTQQITKDGEVTKEIIPPECPQVDLKKGKLPRPGAHGASMYYREDYDSVGGYRELFIYAQDMDLWLRLKEIGDIYTIQEVLYKTVAVEGSVSMAGYETRIEQILCDAAAHQSALHRQNSLNDPIKEITGQDIENIEKVARKGGLHERSVVLILDLFVGCIIDKNVNGMMSCVKFLSPRDYFTLSLVIGYRLKKRIDN